MFDLSQISDSLKSVVPPANYLSFTYAELSWIIDLLRSCLDLDIIELEDDQIEITKAILDKLMLYNFH